MHGIADLRKYIVNVKLGYVLQSEVLVQPAVHKLFVEISGHFSLS